MLGSIVVILAQRTALLAPQILIKKVMIIQAVGDVRLDIIVVKV